jgi:S1-C subfamily serine protease
VAQDGSKDTLLGTAVAIQPGYLVTNQHVVADVLSLSVRQGDRGWVAFRAYTDREWNLALLHAPALQARPAEIGRSDMLQPGEMVYALSPGGREVVFAPAQVSAVQTVGGQRVLDVRVGAAHSRSAGGLFDRRGTLIGLSAYRIWGTEETMRALAGESIAAALRRMRPVR